MAWETRGTATAATKTLALELSPILGFRKFAAVDFIKSPGLGESTASIPVEVEVLNYLDGHT